MDAHTAYFVFGAIVVGVAVWLATKTDIVQRVKDKFK